MSRGRGRGEGRLGRATAAGLTERDRPGRGAGGAGAAGVSRGAAADGLEAGQEPLAGGRLSGLRRLEPCRAQRAAAVPAAWPIAAHVAMTRVELKAT